MTLTFAQVMDSAGIDPLEALVIRHAYVREHGDGSAGIHGDSSDAEIMGYTSNQSANTRAFPAAPPGVWVVFLGQVPGSGVALCSFDRGCQAVSAGRASAPISGSVLGTMLMRQRARTSSPR